VFCNFQDNSRASSETSLKVVVFLIVMAFGFLVIKKCSWSDAAPRWCYLEYCSTSSSDNFITVLSVVSIK
jgi:hypothetical protein